MDGLIGRGEELRFLCDRLRELPARGSVVLLTGAPGIGKTALVEEFARAAAVDGALCLRTSGSPAESHLAYAGLHQLLGDLLEELPPLAPQRRQALLAPFGLAEGRPEPLLIGLALLDVLAGERSVLVVVEDAHWLDRETADLLAFVARRLGGERILMVVTARPGYRNALIEASEQVLPIGPLDDEASESVLSRAAPDLPHEVRSRVLRLASGNPLALLELPRARDEAAGVPTSARLQKAFATRSLALVAPVRAALLVATVDDQADLAEVLAAASAMSGAAVEVDDLGTAVEAGLIRVDGGRLVLRHALIRAAIYEEAGGEQRRQAQLALAGVLRGQPERRAWHLASASLAPDTGLADELERIADGARKRGGLSTALAAQRRAVALSVPGPVRIRRVLDAAELAFQLGERALLEQMLSGLVADELGPAERARLEYLSEAFDFRPWTAETIRAVVDRARAVDDAAALDLLLSVVARSYLHGTDEDVLRRVAQALDELASEQPGSLRALAYAAPVERGGVLIKRLHAALPDASGDPARLYDLAMAAGPVGDMHLQVAAMVPAVELLRHRGQVATLVPALWALAGARYFVGDWAAGMVEAAESTRLAVDTAQPLWAAAGRLTEAAFLAVRGNPQQAAALIEETVSRAPLFAPSQVARANGLVALGEERYDEAYTSIARIFRREDPAYHSALRVWSVVELAESAAGAGRREEATELIAELVAQLDRTPSPLLHASMACARALLAADDEESFAAAVRPELARWPFIWARANLAYGGWLRRQRRVNESRTPLRTAREKFDALGAASWGEKARRELRAAGEPSPVAVAGPGEVLTAQELQIALLAAQGLTNREIGERLFLSHRTVGTYLYQTFPKLGISSRQQLAAALASTHSGRR